MSKKPINFDEYNNHIIELLNLYSGNFDDIFSCVEILKNIFFFDF